VGGDGANEKGHPSVRHLTQDSQYVSGATQLVGQRFKGQLCGPSSRSPRPRNLRGCERSIRHEGRRAVVRCTRELDRAYPGSGPPTGGKVKTTWKYATGSRSSARAPTVRALPDPDTSGSAGSCRNCKRYVGSRSRVGWNLRLADAHFQNKWDSVSWYCHGTSVSRTAIKLTPKGRGETVDRKLPTKCPLENSN
jgi:hypothetical protein